MGNRCVITTNDVNKENRAEKLGVYLHWCGSPEQVEEILDECKAKGIRKPFDDYQYFWARFTQIAANYITGDSDNYETSIGIDTVSKLDCHNCGYYGSAKYKFMNPTKNQVYVKFLKDLNSRENPVTREALVKEVQPRSKQFNPKVYNCNVFSGLREAGLIYYVDRKVCLSMLGKEFLKHFNLV